MIVMIVYIAHREKKVSRCLSQKFGVVRLDRTFSDCIFTGDRRSEGARCTSWMRFDVLEPPTGSGRFNHFEPPRTTTSQS